MNGMVRQGKSPPEASGRFGNNASYEEFEASLDEALSKSGENSLGLFDNLGTKELWAFDWLCLTVQRQIRREKLSYTPMNFH
jgi:hypothetical protein